MLQPENFKDSKILEQVKNHVAQTKKNLQMIELFKTDPIKLFNGVRDQAIEQISIRFKKSLEKALNEKFLQKLDQLIGLEEQKKQTNKTDAKKLRVQLNRIEQKLKEGKDEDIFNHIVKINDIKRQTQKMVKKYGINELEVQSSQSFYKTIKQNIVIKNKVLKKNKINSSQQNSENDDDDDDDVDDDDVDQEEEDNDRQHNSKSCLQNQSNQDQEMKNDRQYPKISDQKQPRESKKRYKKDDKKKYDLFESLQVQNQDLQPQTDITQYQSTKIYRANADSSSVYVHTLGTKTYHQIKISNYHFPCKFASTQFKNQLFITGGMIQNKADDRSFHFKERTLTKLKNMMERRFCHSLVATSKQLYALGGHDGQTIIDKGQVYNQKIRFWNPLPPMNIARQNFGGCFSIKSIYIFCGMINNQDQLFTKSIQRLDTNSKSKWINISIQEKNKEWIRRAWIGAIPISKDQILVFGHQNQSYRSFRYNARTNKLQSFQTEVIPYTTGNWCPAIINQKDDDEIYVASYALINFRVYRFKNSKNDWNEIKFEKKL